jgi:hypothetical protein
MDAAIRRNSIEDDDVTSTGIFVARPKRVVVHALLKGVDVLLVSSGQPDVDRLRQWLLLGVIFQSGCKAIQASAELGIGHLLLLLELIEDGTKVIVPHDGGFVVMSFGIGREVNPQLLAILLDNVKAGAKEYGLEIRVVEIQESGEGIYGRSLSPIIICLYDDISVTIKQHNIPFFIVRITPNLETVHESLEILSRTLLYELKALAPKVCFNSIISLKKTMQIFVVTQFDG